MSDVLLDASVGSRPALKEITENDRSQRKLLAASKKLFKADDPENADDIEAESTENQINEEELDVEGNDHLQRLEVSSQKTINPFNVLSNIINSETFGAENTEENPLRPADETCYLKTASKGKSQLCVPTIGCEALSSDEELFTECETYSTLQMPLEEQLNRSVHWNEVLSNVSSSNTQSLENLEHCAEQTAADATLYLELHHESQIEHQIENHISHSPNSEIEEISRNTKNESAHSPDSTLRHNATESVDLTKIFDNICNEVLSLCNQSSDANISSNVVQPVSPDSSDVETEGAESNVNKSSEMKSCIVRQNSSPKVTSTIESGINLPDETLEVEGDVPTPKLKQLENTFSTTTFNTEECSAVLNQTIELPSTSSNNSFSDQLNISPKVPDVPSNIELEESNKSETNNDTTRTMDQTMCIDHANVAEPMEVDCINSSHRTECEISPKASGKPQTVCEISPKSVGKSQNVFVEELMNQMDVTFNPASATPTEKHRNIDFPSEKDFEGPGIILNSSDFEFLLSKGCNSVLDKGRNSLLLRFDPLVGQLSLVNQSTVYNPNLTIKEEEEDLQIKNRASNQSSEITGTQRKSNDLDIVHTEELLQNVPAQNIKKESESPPQTEPPIAEKLNTSKELKQSNDKMSVDVIQGLDIGNDSKTEESLRQKTENSQEYKVDDMEKKIKNEVLKTEDIEKKLKDAEQREEALLKRITEKDKTIAKMSGVIEAYEKAIAELIAEKEQIIQNYEKQMSEIKSERDMNYKHLTSLESTFTDLHAKYERSKQLTAKLKSSEEDLKQEKKQNLENLRLQEQRYDKMKSHAMQQLEIANNKLESLQKNHSMEVTRLKALLKKEEISRLSVNEQLQQKTRENEELMKICDELINGQGASS